LLAANKDEYEALRRSKEVTVIDKTVKRRWQMDHTDEPVVTFEHVSSSSWGHTILRDVSFRLLGNEMGILLGTSGSGKSQLLKLADGLIRPDSGTVRLFGEDISQMPEESLLSLRSNVGMLFQENALFDSMCVRDNIAYRLLHGDVAEKEVDRKVTEVLSFVELSESSAQFPDELSGGMQRRVAFARAIISDPDLLLYDSPTGGLDPITAARIVDLIIKQRDVHGSSALMVTERLQDAFRISTHRFNVQTNQAEMLAAGHEDKNTRFLFLEDGMIRLDGSVFDLLQSRDPLIKDFLT
jgi:phospholipid/cholesterol/gamma-HCH transport system ATP-binding protein